MSFETTLLEEQKSWCGQVGKESRVYLSFSLRLSKGWPGWFPTARIERPPLYRGGSASNGNLPGYPVYFFCGSSIFSPFLNTP